jgi:hypothetical protein
MFHGELYFEDIEQPFLAKMVIICNDERSPIIKPMRVRFLSKNPLDSQKGVAMTEYAIIFFSLSLVFVIILNNIFIVTGDSYAIRQTIPGLGITNPLYGFKAYFERISDFLALPIP